jgi:hypothetical protein
MPIANPGVAYLRDDFLTSKIPLASPASPLCPNSSHCSATPKKQIIPSFGLAKGQ